MPRSANAQKVEFTPVLGMYTPMGLLVEGRDPVDNSLFRRRQLGALSTGARIGLRTSNMFGIESSFMISPSQVAITDRTRTTDIAGPVALASIRGVFKVNGELGQGAWSFHLAPGLGVVHRYGSAWQSSSSQTDRAYVLAAGWRLGRLHSDRAFRFDVEDYVTRFSFNNSDTQPTSARLHHDVMWSFGLAIPVKGR